MFGKELEGVVTEAGVQIAEVARGGGVSTQLEHARRGGGFRFDVR